MQFVILTGAYKNAGDFLIAKRSRELLNNIFPNAKIIEIKRNEKLEKYLDIINESKALILAGGPLYLCDAYPNVMPLVSELEQIRTKIVTLGCGWSGNDDSSDAMYYEYQFSHSMRKLLDRIIQDQGYLSCRDWLTVAVLEQNGYKDCLMTGCPAWYDIKNIENTREVENTGEVEDTGEVENTREVENTENAEGTENVDIKRNVYKKEKWIYNKICISDPAYPENFPLALRMIEIIKQSYKQANIIFLFHRGHTEDQYTDRKTAIKYQQFYEKVNLMVKTFDISYNSEGFKLYDDCDLHVGFRVHAHIYNLSRGNQSLLVEEDGRGAGVNDALGLARIRAYQNNRLRIFNEKQYFLISRLVTKLHHKVLRNAFFEEELVFNLRKMEEIKGIENHISYQLLKYYYSVMRECIEAIGN